MRSVLPGFLPSGWSKITSKLVVWREDGGAVSSYSGFGLRVLIERPPGVFNDRHRFVLTVTRNDGQRPTGADLDAVRDLYGRVRRARRMKEMLFTLHGAVARYVFIV